MLWLSGTRVLQFVINTFYGGSGRRTFRNIFQCFSSTALALSENTSRTNFTFRNIFLCFSSTCLKIQAKRILPAQNRVLAAGELP